MSVNDSCVHVVKCLCDCCSDLRVGSERAFQHFAATYIVAHRGRASQPIIQGMSRDGQPNEECERVSGDHGKQILQVALPVARASY